MINYCPICGTPTHQREADGRMRAVCLACDRVHYLNPKVAVISFITQDDKLLLIQRGNSPFKGKWCLPGGFLDHDEHPENGAKREALEETGLSIDVDGVLGVFRGTKVDDAVTIAYRGIVTGGILQAGDDAQDVQWFSRDEVPEVVFISSITLVGKWKQSEI